MNNLQLLLYSENKSKILSESHISEEKIYDFHQIFEMLMIQNIKAIIIVQLYSFSNEAYEMQTNEMS